MKSEYFTLLNTILLLAVGVFSYFTKKSVSEVHLSINGRLNELLKVTKLAAHAEGVKEEKERNDENKQ